MNKRFCTTVTFVLLALGLLAVTAQAQEPEPLPSARAGAATFADRCAACHGEQGQGNGQRAAQLEFPPTDFTNADWWLNQTPQAIFDVVRNGRIERFMPPFDSLTDAEIWNTVHFVWSLHVGADQYQQGQEVFAAECAACHGEAGDVPLTQFARYRAQSTQDWLLMLEDGLDGHPVFPADLEARAKLAVVEYARTLTYQSPLAIPTSGEGVVSGQVRLGTSGSTGSVAELPITLHIFDGTTKLSEQQTTTDAQGRFRFEQLATGDTIAYAVTVDYGGYTYGSNIETLADPTQPLDLLVNVYETTDQSAGIQIERIHLILDFENNTMLVGELYFFTNNTDRTYIGTEDEFGQRQVLRFTVPGGVTDLEIEGGGLGTRFIESDFGFFDTQPLPPGQAQRQILFRYSIPYTSNRIRLIRELLYPAANLNALIANKGVQATIVGMEQEGTRGSGDVTYLNFVGTGFAAGQNIEITLTDLPQLSVVSTTITNSPTTLIVGLGAGALVGVGALLYALRRPVAPLAAGSKARTPGQAKALQAERERLIHAIATLDDAFAQGKMTEAIYQKERQRLKADLLDVAARLQESA